MDVGECVIRLGESKSSTLLSFGRWKRWPRTWPIVMPRLYLWTYCGCTCRQPRSSCAMSYWSQHHVKFSKAYTLKIQLDLKINTCCSIRLRCRSFRNLDLLTSSFSFLWNAPLTMWRFFILRNFSFFGNKKKKKKVIIGSLHFKRILIPPCIWQVVITCVLVRLQNLKLR
jgi:hypothetical protein